MAKRFSIDMGDLRHNLGQFDQRANRSIAKVFKYQEAVSETAMRTGAPWTDRTTNARSGLFSKATQDGTIHTLLLSHTVPYGLFLEVRHAGRYAIVIPTWIKTSDELWRLLRKLFRLMQGG